MLISVQIPTYNQQIYIDDAVDSCLMQSHSSLQVIVVDDKSPSYSIDEFLNKYKDNSKLEVHINEHNIGRVKNYNHILNNYVKGEYFINLDGDDYFTNCTFIKEASEILNNYKKYKPVIFEHGHDLENVKSIVKKFTIIDQETILIDGKLYFEYFTDIHRFSHASCIYHTKTAKEIGFYTVDSLSSDYNSTCKIYLHGSVIISSKQVAHWRVHGENATIILGEANIENELRSVLDLLNYAKNKIHVRVSKKVKKSLLKSIFLKKMNIYYAKSFEWKQINFIIINFSLNKIYLKSILKYLYWRF